MAAGPQKWVKLVEFLKHTYPQIINNMTTKKDAKVQPLVPELKSVSCLLQRIVTLPNLPTVADIGFTELASQVVCVQSSVGGNKTWYGMCAPQQA